MGDKVVVYLAVVRAANVESSPRGASRAKRILGRSPTVICRDMVEVTLDAGMG